MSDDDDFFAAIERYQQKRILQGGARSILSASEPYSTRFATLPNGELRTSATLLRSKNSSWY
jgi:hypothetical protein